MYVDADSAGTWESLCINANYALSEVVLTGNHLYYNQSVGPWPLPNMGRDDHSISQLPFTAAQNNTGRHLATQAEETKIKPQAGTT